MNIRKAKPGDEFGISKVHIQAWQEAYKGIVPQAYLDDLPSTYESRVRNWKSSIENPQRCIFVAERNQKIVGFVLLGPPRDPDRESYIELGAIYLLESEKEQGIGFSLLSAGFHQMKTAGYQKAYCWVLEGNPTIQFYERTGAQFSGTEKDDEIGGQKLKELAYEWPDLNLSS